MAEAQVARAAYYHLLSSVETVISDGGFTVESCVAANVLKDGQKLHRWLKESVNTILAEEFAKSVVCKLQSCIPDCGRFKTVQLRRECMWSNYHTLRCSTEYSEAWNAFTHQSLQKQTHPIFWQCIGDAIFRQLIKESFPIMRRETSAEMTPTISHQEANALRYAAGYVPRALSKKLRKSANPLKDQLLLCLLDLLDDGDEVHMDTEEWLDLIDRGGLTRVNEVAFQAFLAMELEVRKHLHLRQVPNFKVDIFTKVLECDDLAFHWSILASDWEEGDSQALLKLVVDLFLTIRGFSYASAWMEKFKSESAKTLQKSKGLRKSLNN